MSQQNKMTSKMPIRENFYLLLKIKANIPKGEKFLMFIRIMLGKN